jgi:hypothetical protein
MLQSAFLRHLAGQADVLKHRMHSPCRKPCAAVCVMPPLVQDGVQALHICFEKGHKEVAAVPSTHV